MSINCHFLLVFFFPIQSIKCLCFLTINDSCIDVATNVFFMGSNSFAIRSILSTQSLPVTVNFISNHPWATYERMEIIFCQYECQTQSTRHSPVSYEMRFNQLFVYRVKYLALADDTNVALILFVTFWIIMILEIIRFRSMRHVYFCFFSLLLFTNSLIRVAKNSRIEKIK